MALETDRSPRAILEELASHPHGDDLARLVHTLAVSAFDERRSTLGEGVDDAASRLGVDEVGAETSFGNVLRALGKGMRASGPERVLLGALVARGVALSPPVAPEAELRVAETLAWSSAHTVADPLGALEAALTAKGAPPAAAAALPGLASALGELVKKHDAGEAGAVDRATALIAALALSRAENEAVIEIRRQLAVGLKDPLLKGALAEDAKAVGTAPATSFSAEEAPLPRSWALTVLLTLTFILPLVAVVKVFARYALRLRQPAEVAFSKEGVTVRSRLEILGKTLRQRETFISVAGLSRAGREVRFPSLPTYAGVAALLCGSYLGLRLVLDGVKGRSPEYLGLGVVILVVALAIDYLLTLLPSRTPDRCRILLEPRRGRAVALAGVERARADEALRLWLP